MIYSQVQPHASLSNYIDAYWTAKGDAKTNTVEKILPDGCIDIIFNFGDECFTDNSMFAMKSEGTFLVGTMTRFKEVLMNAETNLLAIRFKPGAVSAFHKFPSLHEVTSQTIELDKSLPFDTKKLIHGTADYLNHYFLGKLKNPNHFLLQVIETIRNRKGQIKVDLIPHD